MLQPGETLELPMRFIVGSELPKNIDLINLSYTLFDVTEIAASAPVGVKAIPVEADAKPIGAD